MRQSKEATKLAQRIAMAEEQFDQGLRKLTAASKQLASLKRQVRCCCPKSAWGFKVAPHQLA